MSCRKYFCFLKRSSFLNDLNSNLDIILTVTIVQNSFPLSFCGTSLKFDTNFQQFFYNLSLYSRYIKGCGNPQFIKFIL